MNRIAKAGLLGTLPHILRTGCAASVALVLLLIAVPASARPEPQRSPVHRSPAATCGATTAQPMHLAATLGAESRGHGMAQPAGSVLPAWVAVSSQARLPDTAELMCLSRLPDVAARIAPTVLRVISAGALRGPTAPEVAASPILIPPSAMTDAASFWAFLVQLGEDTTLSPVVSEPVALSADSMRLLDDTLMLAVELMVQLPSPSTWALEQRAMQVTPMAMSRARLAPELTRADPWVVSERPAMVATDEPLTPVAVLSAVSKALFDAHTAASVTSVAHGTPRPHRGCGDSPWPETSSVQATLEVATTPVELAPAVSPPPLFLTISLAD